MNLRITFQIVLLSLYVIFMLAACDLAKVELDTRVDLGPNANARMREVNRVLAGGFKVEQNTLNTINDFNTIIAKAVKDGITTKAGLDEATLQRLDNALRLVEDDAFHITGGLDPETLATVNDLINQIDKAPDQWKDTGTSIIKQLENSAGTFSKQMADEMGGLIDKASNASKQLIAIGGIEFRCNVDFMGVRMGDTVDKFIGRTFVARLRAMITGKEPEVEIPIPWVCQIIPDRIELVQIGDNLVFEPGIITITGFNYESRNLPKAFVTDEQGQRIEAVALFPYQTSPYQIGLNLQKVDFSAIPARSRVVFQWPNVTDTSAIAILLPSVTPSPPPQPELVINESSVKVYLGPGANYLQIGIAQRGAKFLVTGKDSDVVWWQIDYNGQKGWVSAAQVTRNEIDVPVATEIPLLPDPSFEARVGCDRQVTFEDSSQRGDTWRWDFGDGATASEQSPTHVYAQDGTYMVKLTVSNSSGSRPLEKTIEVQDWCDVVVPIEPPTPTPTPQPVQADFQADGTEGEPPYTVHFSDLSQNTPTSWEWDFGDNSLDKLSTGQNPTHTYEGAGTYTVKLTVKNSTSSDTETKTAFIKVKLPDCSEPLRTSGVSEETGPVYCPAGYVLKGIDCNSSNCDIITLHCCPYRHGDDMSYREWSPWFSEESPNFYTQTTGFAIGLNCRGNYCDDVQMDILSSPDFKNTGICSFIPAVSEEQGTEGAECGDGWYVAGMMCTGNNCDNVSVYCCQAQ